MFNLFTWCCGPDEIPPKGVYSDDLSTSERPDNDCVIAEHAPRIAWKPQLATSYGVPQGKTVGEKRRPAPAEAARVRTIAHEERESSWEHLGTELEAQKKLWQNGSRDQRFTGAVASVASKIEWAQASHDASPGPAHEALREALQRHAGGDPGGGLLGAPLVEALEDVLDAERRLKACMQLSGLLEASVVVRAADVEAILAECDLSDEKLEAEVMSCLMGTKKQQDHRVGAILMPNGGFNAFDAAALHAPRGSPSARQRRRYGPMSARNGPKGR
jgi:hypothetical protein